MTEYLMVAGLITAIGIVMITAMFPKLRQTLQDLAGCVINEHCEHTSGAVISPPSEAITAPTPSDVGEEELNASNPAFDDVTRPGNWLTDLWSDLKYGWSPEKECPDAQAAYKSEPSGANYNWVKTACAGYVPVAGQAFIQGAGDSCCIDPNDVEQGTIGDCYLMAGLMAIANQNPSLIKNAIQENPDGTYTVTLHVRDVWGNLQEVKETVDGSFPSYNGKVVFAQGGDVANNKTEMWAMVIEKAYAKHSGGYEELVGGDPGRAVELVTGVKAERQPASKSDLTIGWLANEQKLGHTITVGSLQNPGSNALYATSVPKKDRLFAKHAYVVTGVDEKTGTVTVRNPWDWNGYAKQLTWAQFQSSFSTVSVNAIPASAGCPC